MHKHCLLELIVITLSAAIFPVKIMNPTLLQIDFDFHSYKIGMLCFVTAFVIAMLLIPPLIKLIVRFKLYDHPGSRKEHNLPIPTMGGIAVCVGMLVTCLLWFQFSRNFFTISFFFSIIVLSVIGIMDDLNDLRARNKLALQLALALLISFSGVRITNLNGILGIHELPIGAQYTLTVLAIAGITNAFNLLDGIDGLAGGLGFMSLIILGLFLTLCGDINIALIAFAMAGGLLGFLYYNFNPARIFMGDTGSLVLGFVTAVLTVRLIQLNMTGNVAVLPNAPVFCLSLVLIPVFDTLRVFSLRIWNGKSPFDPDKTHIHHLLTNNGWSHSFAAKLICAAHGLILIAGYFLKNIPQELGIVILFSLMLCIIFFFQRLRLPVKRQVHLKIHPQK
jgi:UDP-N-acetylmuramyl pentapeptide phosphotransferase/UDP-N-acetylglucosamine-1-phosphate transferase